MLGLKSVDNMVVEKPLIAGSVQFRIILLLRN